MRNTDATVARLLAACVMSVGASAALGQGDLEVIFTEIPGDPSAAVTGARDALGNPVATEVTAIFDLTPNLDGSSWLLDIWTSQPDTEKSTLLLGSGTSGTVFQQEAQQVPGGMAGEVWDFFDSGVLGGFNAAGDLAFSGRTKGAATREVIMTSDGVTTNLFLAQGDFLTGLADPTGFPGDETLGNAVAAVHRLNDGTVVYRADNIGNLASSLTNHAIMLGIGPAMVQGRVTPVTDLFGNMQLWDGVSDDFAITPDGLHYILGGDHDGSTVLDGILVVDGVVVAQEDSLIPGTTALFKDLFEVGMLPDGTWFARGDESTATDAPDWALRNGELLARTGDPVAVGSLENWGDVIIDITGNQSGAYVIAGSTDNGDPNLNSVIVFNGTDVVVREGDPVDLDGNGMFDDDVFIASLNTAMFLSEDFTLYFLCDLRTGAGVALGDAFLRKTLVTLSPGDITVSIVDAPDPVTSIGDDITYTVRVFNASPNPATNVVATTVLDAATAYVSSTGGLHDGSAMGGTHTATFASIPSLGTETYQIVADTTALGDVTATVSVTASEADPDSSNNTDAATTEVNNVADLAVVIVDTPDPVHDVNGEITYTVTVTNSGPSLANNTMFIFDLPPQATFVSTSHGSHSAGTVTANLGVLPFGGFVDVVIVAGTTVNGTYTASASVESDEADLTPADAVASATTEVDIASDVSVALSDSPDPIIGTGQPVTYTFEISNAGPTAADVDWQVTLPAEMAFASTSSGVHDGSATGGVVSGTSTGLISAGTEIITIQATAVGLSENALATGSATVTSPADPDTSNNVTSASTRILADANGFAQIIFSDNNFALATSVPPQLPAQLFTSFDRPAVSPDGQKWALTAIINAASGEDEILIVHDGTSTFTAVREGTTTVPGSIGLSNVIGFIDSQVGINDSGEYVIASDNIGSISDQMVVKGTGSDLLGNGMFTVIAREDFPVPGVGFNYASDFHSPAITNTGEVWFGTDTDNTVTLEDEFILSTTDDGATVTVRVQQGVTVPANQGGGAMDPWHFFNTERLRVSGDGSTWLFSGDTTTPFGGAFGDEILTVNNSVVIQEDAILDPVFTSPIGFNAAEASYLTGSGDWLARGSNDDGDDWVVRNGTLLARTGTPIFTGASENWDDAGSSDGFFFFPGDSAGNYVIGGFTDAADSSADSVLVLNGERLISREGDPIDVDGNGFFDDDAFIGSYGVDDAIISNGRLIVNIIVRNGVGTTIGDAVVSFDLGMGAACPCEFDGNAGVNVFDLLAYLDLWFVNAPGADIDGNPGVDVFDLLAFLDCWFPASAGAPCP